MSQKTQLLTMCDNCGREHVLTTNPTYLGGPAAPPYIELVEHQPMLTDKKHFCNRRCLQTWLEDLYA